MAKTTLYTDGADFTLRDSDNKVYETPEQALERLRRLRTGTLVAVNAATVKPIPYDRNKAYYLLMDEEHSTMSLIYVNLANNVCTTLAQTNLYLASEWFIKKMACIVGTLRILRSNDRHAWCVDSADFANYAISDEGVVNIFKATPMEKTYRNLKGQQITERWLALEAAVNQAIRYKQASGGSKSQQRFAVRSEKGVIVFIV